MSIDNLRSALPEWAKDLSLNLSTLSRSSSLTEQQQWGTFVAAAAATRNESVLVQVMEDARTHLSEEAISAALGAASIMAMNNVAYRTRHFLGSAYENERMGLRMNIIGTSGGVEKVDFELWSLAVSTINGCEKCVTAHEATVRGEGLSTEQVWEAVRIAATLTFTVTAASCTALSVGFGFTFSRAARVAARQLGAHTGDDLSHLRLYSLNDAFQDVRLAAAVSSACIGGTAVVITVAPLVTVGACRGPTEQVSNRRNILLIRVVITLQVLVPVLILFVVLIQAGVMVGFVVLWHLLIEPPVAITIESSPTGWP